LPVMPGFTGALGSAGSGSQDTNTRLDIVKSDNRKVIKDFI